MDGTLQVKAFLKITLLGLSIFCLISCGIDFNKSSKTGNNTNNDGNNANAGLLTPVETGNNTNNDGNNVNAGLLTPVKTDGELLENLRRGFNKTTQSNNASPKNTEAASTNATVSADSAPSNRSSSNFTTTYTMEKTVDEHDYVKYDGKHLFIAPSRSMDCCFIMEDMPVAAASAAVEPQNTSPTPRGIRIVATNPKNASAQPVATIPLEHNRTVEGLYNTSDQLVSISSTAWWSGYGDSFARVANWHNQTTALDIYDISDINAPKKSASITFEGGFVNSRKKGDMVYIVARHTPYIKLYNYYPNKEQQESNKTLLDNLSINDVLPKVTINNSQSLLVKASDCLITNTNNALAPKENGYPTLTLLVAIDLSTQKIANASCYTEATHGIYVSENAIYLTQVDYENSQPRTLVHSYKLSRDLSYLGSGVAEGALYTSGNKDFRINEYRGYLRLVTTKYTGNSNDRLDHRLTVMQINSDSQSLDTVASLPNSEKPKAIGKPNEQLYGVRFFGDKAYLVTFEQTDPLYVINLSDPTNPTIAGELEVPGFSDFLHPVNDSLLMGLGEDENNNVKLELFNIANMNAPYSLGTVVLGVGESDKTELDTLNWSYSEARYNRHAFTYQAYNNSTSTDRFLVPATLGFYSETRGYFEHDRLFLFEINSKDYPATATIRKVGAITVKRNRESWHSPRNRSVIHGDAVYYIHGTDVWSTLWANPADQSGPY